MTHSVGQELLAFDSGRITSLTWLNGGIYPDLHRPTAGQQALAGPELVEPLLLAGLPAG